PNTVYLAVSGGGLWRTTDFGTYPTWTPMTDTLGALAIGALDVDPNTAGVLWLGLGDAFDQAVGAVAKSTDFGSTWSTPLQLTAPAHPAAGFSAAALNVRDLRIDPSNSNRIFAGTDDGLYVSNNGGASFQIIDLPNATPRRESVWSIVYLGQNAGNSS